MATVWHNMSVIGSGLATWSTLGQSEPLSDCWVSSPWGLGSSLWVSESSRATGGRIFCLEDQQRSTMVVCSAVTLREGRPSKSPVGTVCTPPQKRVFYGPHPWENHCLDVRSKCAEPSVCLSALMWFFPLLFMQVNATTTIPTLGHMSRSCSEHLSLWFHWIHSQAWIQPWISFCNDFDSVSAFLSHTWPCVDPPCLSPDNSNSLLCAQQCWDPRPPHTVTRVVLLKDDGLITLLESISPVDHHHHQVEKAQAYSLASAPCDQVPAHLAGHSRLTRHHSSPGPPKNQQTQLFGAFHNLYHESPLRSSCYSLAPKIHFSLPSLD